MGISQKKLQKKLTEEGRKDKTTDSREQNIRRRCRWHFSRSLCVWMRLAITSAKWNSQKLPKMLTHLWSLSSSIGVRSLTSDCSRPFSPGSRSTAVNLRLNWPSSLVLFHLYFRSWISANAQAVHFFINFWRQDLPRVTHSKRSFRQFDAVLRCLCHTLFGL